MRNIVLIGMPASGKSTIGKMLADEIEYEYFDADHHLEKQENRKISDIFAEDGEDYFRNLETKYLGELAQKENIIISTGGGAVKRKENIDLVKKNGIVIFLNRKIEDIAKENHKNRPLLQDINNLQKLYCERIDLYNKYADIVVENDDTLENVVKKIIKELKNKNFFRK